MPLGFVIPEVLLQSSASWWMLQLKEKEIKIWPYAELVSGVEVPRISHFAVPFPRRFAPCPGNRAAPRWSWGSCAACSCHHTSLQLLALGRLADCSSFLGNICEWKEMPIMSYSYDSRNWTGFHGTNKRALHPARSLCQLKLWRF